jgi:hypothetical protein
MGKQLPISLKPQECTQWCWAAVTTAIGAFYQDDQCPTTQCEVVSQVLNIGRDCCSECDCKADPFDPCNQPKNIAFALNRYQHGLDGPAGTTLSFSDIQDEINNNHPIAVSVRLNDPAATSHAIVIFGYTDDGKLNVADPMQPGSQISATLDELLNGTSSELHGTWQSAFRTKRRDE